MERKVTSYNPKPLC